MKKLFTLLLLAITSIAIAQPVTKNDIAGHYDIAKMFLGDTLFYDVSNPAKSNKNILIDIAKYNPPIAVTGDSTLALSLFYKDIEKSLLSYFYFSPDGKVSSYYNKRREHEMHSYDEETWDFDQTKQLIIIKSRGNPTEKYPVGHNYGKITVTIEDKKEHTTIVLQKQ